MNLPGFMESVFSFVTAKDLKAELNAQFRAKVDTLPESPFPVLTLLLMPYSTPGCRQASRSARSAKSSRCCWKSAAKS